MNIQKILVPVDFSDCSRNALRSAANLGRLIDAELLLVHAYHVPVPHVEAGASAMVQPLMEGYEENVESEFQVLINQVPELDELSYDHRCVHGFATDAIHSIVDSDSIDLIIMGTKGASGIIEKLIGSITAQVIKESKCPVIAIPTNADLKSISRIALATDNQPVENTEVCSPVVRIAEAYNAEVHLLNILEDESARSNEADQVMHQLIPSDVKHSYHYSSDSNIEKGIMDYIKDQDIQLIGVLPRHHSIIERIFSTSLTEKLAFHTTIPLLVMHETDC